MYLLGVDFGGSSTKATLLDQNGRVIATSSCEYPSICPKPLFIEQNPYTIYDAFKKNLSTLFLKTAIKAGEISTICLDGGTHIAVLMDEKDNVIRPAIYWSDGRSKEESAALTTEQKQKISNLSFNLPSPTWTLPQLLWIKKYEPDNFKKIKKIRFLKDYIRFRLTGDFVTDSIEAMGSMLVDSRVDSWSSYLCDICGLNKKVLPEIVKPEDMVGNISAKAAEETGLSTKTKVIVGSTDTVMEVFASGAIHSGDATIKLATAGRICIVTPKPIVSGLLVTYKHLIEGLWYPGTATKTCAASLRWFRDTFSSPLDNKAYEKIDSLASKTKPGSDNLFFHPYLQGEITPYQDSALRASFTGISSAHTYGHFCRSVLEGVGYSLMDCLASLESLGLKPTKTLRIIGGGSKSELWCKIISDMLNQPLEKVITDDSSIGSAMLAGISAGAFSDWNQAVEATTKIGRKILPKQENSGLYKTNFRTYKKIVNALQSIYQEMSN